MTGRPAQLVGMGNVTALGAPQRHAEPVVVVAFHRARRDRVRELAAHRVEGQCWDARPNHLAEQRMGQTHLAAIPVVHGGHTPAQEPFRRLLDAERAYRRGSQRLTQRDQLERALLGLDKSTDVAGDDLCEPLAGQQRAGPTPHVCIASQPVGIESELDQLAEEQRIPGARVRQHRERSSVDRATERACDELVALGARKGLQRDERCVTVLPQCRDRTRKGRTAAIRHDGPRNTARHRKMHERRRRLVEQVRVVDTEQDAPAAGPIGERGGDALQRRPRGPRHSDPAPEDEPPHRKESAPSPPSPRPRSARQSRVRFVRAPPGPGASLPTPAAPVKTTLRPPASVRTASDNSSLRPTNRQCRGSLTASTPMVSSRHPDHPPTSPVVDTIGEHGAGPSTRPVIAALRTRFRRSASTAVARGCGGAGSRRRRGLPSSAAPTDPSDPRPTAAHPVPRR